MGIALSKLCGNNGEIMKKKMKKKVKKIKKNLTRDRRAEIIYRQIRMEDFETDSDEDEDPYGLKRGIGI